MKYAVLVFFTSLISLMIAGCALPDSNESIYTRTIHIPSNIYLNSTGNTLYTSIDFYEHSISRSMRMHQGIKINPWVDLLSENDYFWNVFYQFMRYQDILPDIKGMKNSDITQLRTVLFNNRETASGSSCMNIGHDLFLGDSWSTGSIVYGMNGVDGNKEHSIDLPLVSRWTEDTRINNEYVIKTDNNIPANLSKNNYQFIGSLQEKFSNNEKQTSLSVQYQECEVNKIQELRIPLILNNKGIGKYVFLIHKDDLSKISIQNITRLVVSSELEYKEKKEKISNQLICFENECSILFDMQYNHINDLVIDIQ